MTKLESSLTKIISSLENRSSSFLIIFLVRNQSGTNFNVGGKASTALPHISWVFCLSRQYFWHKRIFEKSFITNFLGFISIENRIKYKCTSINTFNTHFLSLILIRNELYCKKISIGGFIAHFLSLKAIRNNF